MGNVHDDWDNTPTQAQVNDAATRDYAEAELHSKIEAQMVQNQCAMVTAQALEALAKPETEGQRRNRIAEGFAFSMACVMDAEPCAVAAVAYADALIKELDK